MLLTREGTMPKSCVAFALLLLASGCVSAPLYGITFRGPSLEATDPQADRYCGRYMKHAQRERVTVAEDRSEMLVEYSCWYAVI